MRPPSIQLVSIARTLLANVLIAGVSVANAQMIEMMKMDDARYYLLGSVSYAELDCNQSDISDIYGLKLDDSDVTVLGGLGIKISEVSASGIVFSDLGFTAQIDNIASVLTSKVDTELDEVFEFSEVTQFDTGSSFKPIERLAFL